MKEIIYKFSKEQQRRTKKLLQWFFNYGMEEEARIQVSFLPYERTEETKGLRKGSRTRSLKTVDGKSDLNNASLKSFSLGHICLRNIQ